MSLSYEKLVSTFAFFLLLMEDYEKSSNFLFQMVEERNDLTLASDNNFNDIREFVLDIVEIISVVDPCYSEKMARNYYELVTELK